MCGNFSVRMLTTAAVAIAAAGLLHGQSAQPQPTGRQGGQQQQQQQAQPPQQQAGNQSSVQPTNQSPAQPTNQSPAQPTNQSPAEPAPPPPKPLDTKFVTSKDGTKIAYDVTGSGPALMLLHGAGQERRDWHDAKYVDQLSVGFSVITVDIRGSGESDKPRVPEAYEVDRLIEDFLAVADAARAPRFHVWGYSYGATVGRYLATRTDRVISMVYIGAEFGPAINEPMGAAIAGMRERWTPVLEAHRQGEIDPKGLSETYRSALEGGIPLTVARMGALLDYPPVEPADMTAPTLWLVGTDNPDGMASVKAYEGKLEGTQVTIELMNGLNHGMEFHKTADVFQPMLQFTAKHRGSD